MQKLETLPTLLDGIMTQELYSKSRLYSLDKSNLGIFKAVFATIYKTVGIVYRRIVR